MVAGVLGDATAHSQALEHPVGFAAIVAKVKPAVTSVRVKIDAGPLNDLNSPFSDETPLERFLRRFGVPNDTPERSPGPSDRDFVTGQGSGFFISADGYAVTNGHVVSQAKSVEVTTDSGKTYTARVIGLDSAIRYRAHQGGRRHVSVCRICRQGSPGRRLGPRHRQSVRSRRHCDGGYCIRARTRYRRRPLR